MALDLAILQAVWQRAWLGREAYEVVTLLSESGKSHRSLCL